MTEVSRSVGTRTVDGERTRVATIARTYPTGIEDLWDACTTAERLARWFLPVTGDLRVGGRYQLEGNASGTVEHCEAPHRFVATWEFAGGVSRITVTLTAVDADRTRLELEHVPMMCIPKFGSWLLFADVSSIARQIGRRSLSEPLLDPYQRQLQWGWPL